MPAASVFLPWSPRSAQSEQSEACSSTLGKDFLSSCLSCRQRDPRGDKVMAPRVREEQPKRDYEEKEWKLKMPCFSHIQDVPETVSVGRHTARGSALCKHWGRAKGQTMPGTQCGANASLGHGSLFRQKHFSNKFTLLKTTVCHQHPQNGWQSYCHWQYRALSIDTDPQTAVTWPVAKQLPLGKKKKQKGGWRRCICKHEAALEMKAAFPHMPVNKIATHSKQHWRHVFATEECGPRVQFDFLNIV